uniref:Signal recognition particle receptor subunit beta n=1 Tax=Mycena chlorophos TaxID=658473 RepID=A0ABQ0MA07_MYCCL|nr:predicted protein [Mycena chlorophos]
MDSDSFVEPEVAPVSATFSPQILAAASLLLAVVVLGFVLLCTRRKSRSAGQHLLLVGPPDAGKTAILSSLAYKQTLPSHTSLQTNSSVITLAGAKKTVAVVDIPGHPRLRNQVNEHVSDAKAIAFVVDSSTISRNGPAVAEHLHVVLNAITSLPPSQVLPTLIILAHKSDLVKAGSSSTTPAAQAVNRVKTILERELEKRRVAQSGGVGVEGLGEEGERTEMGGLECTGEKGVFQFDTWEGGEVVFLGTSTKVADEKSGLDSLEEWFEENA